MSDLLDIDQALVTEARKVGGHCTDSEAVAAALREYIAQRRSRQVLSLFSRVDYGPTYDYKRLRRAKRGD